nr:unnamed protein product [Callosobruchus analis]
MWWKPQ